MELLQGIDNLLAEHERADELMAKARGIPPQRSWEPEQLRAENFTLIAVGFALGFAIWALRRRG